MNPNMEERGYCIVPFHLVHIMKLQEAFLLSVLLGMSGVWKRRKEGEENEFVYFQCSYKRLENITKWSQRRLEDNIKSLREQKWILTKRGGRSGQLFVKINRNIFLETANRVPRRFVDLSHEDSWGCKRCINTCNKYLSKERYEVDLRSRKKHLKSDGGERNKPSSTQEKGNIPLKKQKIDPRLTKNPPKEKTSTSKIDPYIEFWNKQRHVSKHKNPSSKRYKQASTMLRRLTRNYGLNVELSPSFMEHHKIPKSYLIKKWTRKEVFEGLERMARLHDPRYTPLQKNFSKDLANLVYNPITETSMFLRVMKNPPRRLSEKYSELDDPADQYTAEVLRSMFPEKEDHTRINRAAREINREFHKIVFDEHNIVKREIPMSGHFVQRYVEWLKRLPYPPRWVDPILPSKRGGLWGWFMRDLQEYFNVDFRTGGEYGITD